MQKHSYYLIKYFTQQAVYVDLYHLNDSSYDINRLEFFTEEEKKYITPFVFTFPNKGKWPWHYLQESYLHSKMMYKCFVEQAPVDFIYSKGYTGWYFIKQKKKGVKLPPIGLRLHGYEIFQAGKGLIEQYRKIIYLPLVKYLNKSTDYIYSYGGGITDIILKNIPHSKEKIIEIPAGIDPSWIYEKNVAVNTPIRFAFLGRYEVRKGILELNTALKNIIGKYDFAFHFVGNIPDDFKINSSQLIYHGQITDVEKIKSILKKTDVFILPSHSEGMPNVILEAMASGCAILATNVGAVSIMVASSNGWLLPPIDEKALEEKMMDIIKGDTKEIERKKASSVNKIKENFIWNRIIVKEMNVIREKI